MSETGLSISDAEAIITHQTEMDEYQERVQKAFPERYGGAYHVRDGASIETVILFRGTVPDNHPLLKVDLPDSVIFKESTYSLRDWEQMSIRVHGSLSKLDLESWITGVDLKANTISIEFNEGPNKGTELRSELSRFDSTEVQPSTIDDIRTIAKEAIGRSNAGQGQEQAHMVVTRTTSGVVTETHSYGGDRLLDDGNFECTSGFTARRNGADGVITAGHCSGLNQYQPVYGSAYSAPYQSGSQHIGQFGDMEFHTTSHIEYDDFYATGNVRFDVASVKAAITMDIGDVVCRYGRKTGNGYGCKAITRLFITVTTSSGTVGRLVETHPTGDQVGDSGGPWYVGNAAWGIQMGHISSNGRSLFTAATQVEGTIGAIIKH